MCTSSLSLNTRTDGASTTPRGSPFHTLGVLTVRKCFLASKWNLGSLSFAPLESVLPSSAGEDSQPCPNPLDSALVYPKAPQFLHQDIMRHFVKGLAETQLSKIYGEIFTIWIGHLPMVVVNGFHPVKHVLVNHAEEVSWRVVSPFVRDMMHEKGILFSGGHIWKEQRKFGVATLRLLGFGRSNMEHRVQEEASNLVALLASEKGKPLDPALPLFHAVSNVISSVVFGHRFSIQDETFCKLVECIEYEAHFFLSKCHFLSEAMSYAMQGQLNAEFQRIARRDKNAFLNEQCKEIEENNRIGRTRDLFKKIGDMKGTFHAKMGMIKDQNGRDITEAEEIKKRWQDSTEELYKKELNVPENYDGVVTDLKPDILE
ncbi:Cytochrome P450 2C39 [Varanus komodoensis]|nr:Cytochrome P450 2C39 [Varanus komodoensis]